MHLPLAGFGVGFQQEMQGETGSFVVGGVRLGAVGHPIVKNQCAPAASSTGTASSSFTTAAQVVW